MDSLIVPCVLFEFSVARKSFGYPEYHRSVENWVEENLEDFLRGNIQISRHAEELIYYIYEEPEKCLTHQTKYVRMIAKKILEFEKLGKLEIF